MGPTLKRIERPTVDELKTAIAGLHDVDGHLLHPIAVETVLDDECHQVRLRFWLGARRDQSAIYTFTFTNHRSISENLAELEDFVREQYLIATHPPE